MELHVYVGGPRDDKHLEIIDDKQQGRRFQIRVKDNGVEVFDSLNNLFTFYPWHRVHELRY